MTEAKHTRKSVKDYVKPKVRHCNHVYAVNDTGKVSCVKCYKLLEPRDGSKKEKDRVRIKGKTRDVKMPPKRR